jgi:tetratricopeptide (TPR) repeat protein
MSPRQRQVQMLARAVAMAGCLMFTGLSVAQDTTAYANANSLLHQGKDAEAAQAFEALDEKQPAATDALLQAAKARIHQQDYKSAETDLTHFLASHPRSDDALYLLSFVYFREGFAKQSLQAATRAAAIRRPTADDLKIVGLDYSLLGDFDDAAKYLEMAREMDPRNAEILYFLGRVRYQQNRFDDAISAFRAVLSIDPEHVKAADNLGLALEGKGDLESAEEAYRNAIEIEQKINDGYERPWLNLGRLLREKNDLKDAIPALRKAAEINSSSADALLELGKAEISTSDLQQARKDLERSIELDANSIPAHYSLARLYKKIGEEGLAAKEFALTEKLNQSSH